MEIDDFLKWRDARRRRATGRPYAENTQATVRNRISSAMSALGTDQLTVLADKTQSAYEIEQLFDTLSLTNGSSSLRLVYEALKSLHAYAFAKKWVSLPFPSTDDLKPPSKDEQKHMDVYTEAELLRLVETARARSLRWFMLIATMVHTGRRIGEVRAIEWDMLSLEPPKPHFTLPPRIVKTRTQQEVGLNRFLREEVYTPANIRALQAQPQKHMHRSPAVYPFPWRYKTAKRMLDHHCQLIGIEAHGFHRFRHSFATHKIEKGIPIQAVSAWLGHAQIQTTDRMYNHVRQLDYFDLLDD